MISAQTLRVCREGKPAPTFPDHAVAAEKKKAADHIRRSLFGLLSIWVAPGRLIASRFQLLADR
jgi:hypothetical protein